MPRPGAHSPRRARSPRHSAPALPSTTGVGPRGTTGGRVPGARRGAGPTGTVRSQHPAHPRPGRKPSQLLLPAAQVPDSHLPKGTAAGTPPATAPWRWCSWPWRTWGLCCHRKSGLLRTPRHPHHTSGLPVCRRRGAVHLLLLGGSSVTQTQHRDTPEGPREVPMTEQTNVGSLRQRHVRPQTPRRGEPTVEREPQARAGGRGSGPARARGRATSLVWASVSPPGEPAAQG